MKRVLLVLAVIGLFACPLQASVLPMVDMQKWEASLDGFGAIFPKDVNQDGAPDYIVGRNLVKVDSRLKSQGDVRLEAPVPGPPSNFRIGLDPTPGKVADYNVPPNTLAFMSTGLRLIAVDVTLDNGITYTQIGPAWGGNDAQLLAWMAGGPNPYDVLYFGDETDVGLAGTGYFYHDADLAAAFQPFGGLWDKDFDADVTEPHAGDPANVEGDFFDTNGVPGAPDIGAGVSNNVLILDFLSIAGLRVDGTLRAAPPGTVLANVNDPQGTQRPLAFFDVIGGTEWNAVLVGGMKSTLQNDSNGNGVIDPGDVGSTTIVCDVISALASQTLGFGAGGLWSTLSDPTEWVSTPEPASVLIWGALGLLGLACFRRKRG